MSSNRNCWKATTWKEAGPLTGVNLYFPRKAGPSSKHQQDGGRHQNCVVSFCLFSYLITKESLQKSKIQRRCKIKKLFSAVQSLLLLISEEEETFYFGQSPSYSVQCRLLKSRSPLNMASLDQEFSSIRIIPFRSL